MFREFISTKTGIYFLAVKDTGQVGFDLDRSDG